MGQKMKVKAEKIEGKWRVFTYTKGFIVFENKKQAEQVAEAINNAYLTGMANLSTEINKLSAKKINSY
jgi:hypothetical protein